MDKLTKYSVVAAGILGALIPISMLIGVVYIIWHFLAKFW